MKTHHPPVRFSFLHSHVLKEAGKALVQPQIIPPVHCNNIPKPLRTYCTHTQTYTHTHTHTRTHTHTQIYALSLTHSHTHRHRQKEDAPHQLRSMLTTPPQRNKGGAHNKRAHA